MIFNGKTRDSIKAIHTYTKQGTFPKKKKKYRNLMALNWRTRPDLESFLFQNFDTCSYIWVSLQRNGVFSYQTENETNVFVLLSQSQAIKKKNLTWRKINAPVIRSNAQDYNQNHHNVSESVSWSKYICTKICMYLPPATHKSNAFIQYRIVIVFVSPNAEIENTTNKTLRCCTNVLLHTNFFFFIEQGKNYTRLG